MTTRGSAARWLLVVALLLAGGLVPALSPAPARAAGPVRILLSGDSITQGFDGDYTWRLRLWQEFQRQGVPVDFVGSEHLPYVQPGFTTSHYLDPNFDQDHFAFGGRQLGWLADRIGPEVATQQPDVVVIAAGVNDLRWHKTPADTIASLQEFVANARAAEPDVRIIVSPVLPAINDPERPWLPTVIAQYDALLPGAVAALSTTASPVTLADTTAGWDPRTDTYFGLHPTPTGETLIAQHVAEALQQVGILPQPPQVVRSIPWDRDLTATVVVRHHRVRLRWDREALTGVRIWLARVGRGSHGRFVARRGNVGRSTLTGLRPGRYEVRLVAIRHWMRSPLGPPVRFRVR